MNSITFCPYCGNKISQNFAFCSSCGKPIGNANSQIPTRPTQNGPTQQPMYAPEPLAQPVYMYQQPQQPQQGNQTTIIMNERKTNGLGTAGFVLALLAILLSWVPWVDFIMWFLGFIFSFIGMFKAPKGLAIAGFIISIIGLIVIIAIFGGIATIANQI